MKVRRTTALAAAGATVLNAVFAMTLLVAAAGICVPAPRLYAESANADFKAGQNAEAREDYDAAFDAFQKAFNKNPKDARFKIALARVRVTAASVHISKGRKLLDAGDAQGALAEFLHAQELDPSDEAARQEIAHVREQQGQGPPAGEVGLPEPANAEQELSEMAGPVELKPISNEPLSLHMSQDAKVVYEAVGKAAGINVLFDPDYQSKRIDVDLNNVSLMDGLRIVSVMSNTFWRPVTNNTIFVAQNTRIKRQELDEEAVQTFYLSNAWQQNDLNDVQTALRSLITNGKFYAIQSQNAIVARGTPDELLLAEQLVHNLDKARGEVVVDIAVLEVSKNWEKNLGLSWPSSFGVSLQPSCAASNTCGTSTTNSTTTNGSAAQNTLSPTLFDLAHLKATDFQVNVGSATLNLLLTDNNTKVLQSPRMRSTDGQKASMKIGSRIPIATGSYQTGAATALVSSLVNTQFQYQDVGVNIEMTPTVHFDHDVTLNLKIDVSSETGTQNISGVTEPIFSQRVVTQVIRLREGEASLLGGIQNSQEEQNWSGIPGLSAIPILKYAFGSKDHVIQDDDIVFVVVPHIVRSQELDQSNLRVVDTGEGGQSIDLRRESDGGPTAVTQPVTRNTLPASPARSTMGTVAGQNAIVAAPEMLAQLRADIASNGGPAATAQAAVPPLTSPPSAPPNVPQAAANVPAPAASRAAPVPSPPTPAPAPATAPPPGATTAPKGPSATFALNVPAGTTAAGSTLKVPVVLTGGVDVASAALQIHYDPAKLILVNVAVGDLLIKDGQAAQPAHTDMPLGNLTLGIARPPGAAGVSGTGVVCTLTFLAKTQGPGEITIVRAAALNSAQQQLSVQSAQSSTPLQ